MLAKRPRRGSLYILLVGHHRQRVERSRKTAPKRLHQSLFFLMWISLVAAVVLSDIRQRGLWEAILLDTAIALMLFFMFRRLREASSR